MGIYANYIHRPLRITPKLPPKQSFILSNRKNILTWRKIYCARKSTNSNQNETQTNDVGKSPDRSFYCRAFILCGYHGISDGANVTGSERSRNKGDSRFAIYLEWRWHLFRHRNRELQGYRDHHSFQACRYECHGHWQRSVP